MSVAGQDEVIGSGTCPEPTGDSSKPERSRWAAALVIVSAGVVTYLDSFQGAFVYDERVFITDNPYIRHLWPPWPALLAPLNVNRPVIGLSNAINYAISGLNPWSYHATNLIIHILAALALFGIVRRTLTLDKLVGRFGKHSTILAMTVALIWMVHPLQTQSVTYVIQRCESLMGMFYLVTLYSSIRSFESDHKGRWYAAAIAACAGGMMSKQVMVTAPIVVLLYDFLFEAGSLRQALRQRWALYSGLGATWGILAATVAASPVNPTAGFAVNSISPVGYLKSEFAVVVYYLRLSFWPSPLCLDYSGWPVAKTAAAIAPFAVILGGLGAFTAWGILRRRPASFVGAWFFLIISVTSSVMPFSDLVFEHRMYLPLASVVAIVVLGAYSLADRLRIWYPSLIRHRPEAARQAALVVITLVVVLLGFATARRNIDYRSEAVMWTDVVAKRPDNPRAHNNLGHILLDGGRVEGAIVQFSEAVALNPYYTHAQYNLGTALMLQGKLDEARVHLIEAVRLDPGDPNSHVALGTLFGAQGQTTLAINEFEVALQIDPATVEAHRWLGVALESQGRVSEAKEQYNIALQLRPDWPELRDHIAGLR